MISAESLLDRLGAKRNGKEFQARCPAHDDSTPSLSIQVRPDKILLCCRAGCSQESVLAALHIEARDLFLHAVNGNGRAVAEYSYTDEKSKLLFQVVRYEPGKNGKKKDFSQRRPDGNGGWINDMDGVRLVLYQLPLVIGVSSILICEGEKDCDTARKNLSVPATCNVTGAGKWKAEYNECLRGKEVSIIADADEPGRKHAQHVAASLHSIAKSVKVLELPGAKDLTEWVEHGGTQDALTKLIGESPEWKPVSSEEIASTSELSLPDMPDSVLDGRLGEIYRKHLKVFPIAYAWPALLAAAGALVRPVQWPATSIFRANLYVALVGPAGSGKSTAIDRALHFADVRPPVLEKTKSGSAEGLLKKIGDLKGGRVFLFPDELSHLLEKTQIMGASFPYILNTAFYEDEQNLTIAKGEKVKFDCRMSVVGGLVDEKFGESFSSATTGGLYDRFIFGQCPTGFQYLWRPIEGTPALDGEFNEMPVNQDVFGARDDLVKKENLSPRLLELALRCAAICAAIDGRTLRAADLAPAWELARYQNRVRMLLRPNAGKNLEGQAARKLLDYLDAHLTDDKCLKVRDVLTATHLYDFGPALCERVINGLAFAGEIEQFESKNARGRRVNLIRRVKVGS